MDFQNAKWQEFANRLQKIYKHRSKTARRQQISCYRIYDNDLPSFPFVIEIYGANAYVAEYHRNHGMDEATHEDWLTDCIQLIAHVLEMPEENVYVRQRKRMTHRNESQYQKLNYDGDDFDVQEGGLNFIVNLSQYLDTGLFLDHRVTRNMVRNMSKDKRVLNLFCYTSSFSVYAAAGGANEVVSVDLSKTYLSWSERNFKLNDLENDSKYKFIHQDVIQYLKTLAPDSFDIIVMDPPTFSNSKRMKDILDIQRDHAELINDALRALGKEGVLIFSTNSRKFELEQDAIVGASSIKDITKLTTPFDFEGKLFRWCYEIKK